MENRDKLRLLGLAGASLGVLWGWRAWRRSRRRIELRGRVVLITGSSSGHGLLLARHAASEGAHLVLAAREAEPLHEAEDDLRRSGAASVMAVATDVGVDEQVQRLVASAIERHGRIDVLINNAGTISVGPIDAMTVEDFRDVMATNFWGALQMTLAVLPHMKARGYGRIGNVVSLGGKRAVPHMLPYTASKFALSGLTEGLRAELAKDNILVTGLYPATMRTGSQQHAEFKGNRNAEYSWFALSATAPGLASSAEQVARMFWRAVCDGEAEVIVGWSSYLAVLAHDLLPNEASELLAQASRLLPDWQGGPNMSVRGENLEGPIPRVLNQVVPERTRPETKVVAT